MRYNPGTRIVLKVIFLGMGSMMALVGIVMLLNTALALSKAERTTGTVVAFSGTTPPAVAKGPPPEPTVAPVVAFTPMDGNERRFTANWHASEPSHALGDRVPVFYLPANPAKAWIGSFAETWALPVIFAAIGGTMLLIGFFIPLSRT